MSEKDSTVRDLLLQPGTLWDLLVDQTQYALEVGALQSIPTGHEFVEQNGIQFLVRVLANLIRKDEAIRKEVQQAASSTVYNPFLPYEQDLFVADLSMTHVCLLNKFNVVDHHLLIITRDFEEQECWLNLRDFEALWACMAEIDGLAFYNGGRDAGASQRHKHLQLVPLPIAPEGDSIPLEPAIATAQFQSGVGRVAALPYVHAIARLELTPALSWRQGAESLLETYDRLMGAVGLRREAGRERQSGAYNLLVTRRWMMLIPRSQEAFDGIAVNSLGFAGALLVRNDEQMQRLKVYEPLTVLRNVAYPR